MATCGHRESQGRSVLLYAVSTVLEYLQWSEARTFHNMLMTKIEQGRADWSTDFSSLADNFIDKKVRLRYRNSGANGSSSYRGGYGNKSFGKGFGKGFKGAARFNTGRGKPLYGAVCWQWNFGTCTYGSDCKRWHTCKSCADAGKLGEYHKATTHESSNAKSKGGER